MMRILFWLLIKSSKFWTLIDCFIFIFAIYYFNKNYKIEKRIQPLKNNIDLENKDIKDKDIKQPIKDKDPDKDLDPKTARKIYKI
jgi:hypothetical protein